MIHPLDDLLDQAHRALLSGDLAQLDRLAPQLAAQETVPFAMDAATAGRLRQKASRNARLLQASLAGLRAARGRLLAMAGGADLTTYDAQGRKATLTAPPPAPSRRF